MENKFKSLVSVIREMNRNSAIRMKDVETVDRNTFNKRDPKDHDANVKSPESELSKQGQIKTKIIDERKKLEKEDDDFDAAFKAQGDNIQSMLDKDKANFAAKKAASSTPSAPAPSSTPASTSSSDQKIGIGPNDQGPVDKFFGSFNRRIVGEAVIDEAKDKNFDNIEGQDKTDGASKSPKKMKPTDDDDRDLDDPKAIKGGKTEVDLNPKTDDKVNSETDEDDASKKARRKANKEIGQKTMKEEYHVHDHPVYGKVLAKNGKAVLADYDKADELATKHKGTNVIKTLHSKTYMVKMPEHMPHGKKIEETAMFKSDTKFGLPDGLISSVKEIMEKKLSEKLTGNQDKIDANHNGKIDAQDFKILRSKKKMMEAKCSKCGSDPCECKDMKEDTEQLDEISKGLAKKYLSKAKKDMKKHEDEAGEHYLKSMEAQHAGDKENQSHHWKQGSKSMKAAIHRDTGVMMAKKKLGLLKQKVNVKATEEVEFSDEELVRIEEISKGL